MVDNDWYLSVGLDVVVPFVIVRGRMRPPAKVGEYRNRKVT